MPFIYKIEPWKSSPVFVITWWNKRKITFSSVASLICFIIYSTIENKKGTIFLCLKPNKDPVPIRLLVSQNSSHSRQFSTSKESSIRKKSWHFQENNIRNQCLYSHSPNVHFHYEQCYLSVPICFVIKDREMQAIL